MYAGRSRRSNRAALLGACIAVATGAGPPAGTPSALASVHCPRFSPNQPCLGPIVSEYNYEDRFSEGATWLFKASFGPSHPLDETHPFVERRSVSWHPVRGIKIVAAFVVTRTDKPKLRFHYKRVPTDPHSGHVTLTRMSIDHLWTAPLLLLEGEKAASVALSAASGASMTRAKVSHCIFRGVPCLGNLEAYYAFNGNTAGAIRSLIARLGPEEPTGTDAGGDLLVKRALRWHTASGVKLVAAFEVIAPDEHHVHIHRLATGAHSGEVTFTIVTSPANHRPIGHTIPVLLLEGSR